MAEQLKISPQSKLDRVLQLFGWTGGTVHQANEEAGNCLECSVDIGVMSEPEFLCFLKELTINYPRWIAFQAANEREFQ